MEDPFLSNVKEVKKFALALGELDRPAFLDTDLR